jgi:hypothetical protein
MINRNQTRNQLEKTDNPPARRELHELIRLIDNAAAEILYELHQEPHHAHLHATAATIEY